MSLIEAVYEAAESRGWSVTTGRSLALVWLWDDSDEPIAEDVSPEEAAKLLGILRD